MGGLYGFDHSYQSLNVTLVCTFNRFRKGDLFSRDPYLISRYHRKYTSRYYA